MNLKSDLKTALPSCASLKERIAEELVEWLREQSSEDKAERMVAELQTFGLTA